MKKALKSSVLLTFCLCIIMSTIMMVSAIDNVKNAKASSITYNSATLSWSKVKGADGYEIYQYKSKKWTKIKTTTSTSYKLTKLTTGTTYKYRIRAYDKGLLKTTYSKYTGTISVKPVPAKVTGLKATASNTTTVKLSWSKVSGATGYQVQQYVNKQWKSIKNLTANSYNVSKLKLGTTYKFRVRAYRTVSNKKIYGAVSSTVSAKTIVQAPKTVKSKSITATSGTVYWSAVSDAQGYQIYNPVTKKWVTTKSTRNYTHKSLKAGTKYTYQVRAYVKVSGKNYFSASKSYSFTTAPAQVTGVKLSSIATNSMKASWTATKSAAGYQVYLYDYSGAKKWTLYKTVTTNNITITGLKTATQYAVRVRAYVNNPDSTNYGAWSATLKTYTAPAATGSISFSNVKINALTVNWGTVSGAAGYEIYNPRLGKWVDTKTARTYNATTLYSGSKYTFKVRAYTLYGSTKVYGATKEAAVTTTPAQVTGLKISNITKNALTASWATVKGASGYQVALYNYNTKTTTKTNTTKLTLTLSNLSPGVKYKVSVAAYVKNPNATSYSTWVALDTITAPNSPANVKYKNVTASSITIYWDAVSGANGYQVYNPVTKKWVGTGTATTYTLSSLSAAKKYEFQVRAYSTLNSANTYSAAVKYSVSTAPGQPKTAVSDTYSKSFVITWPKVAGASGYEVQQYVSGKWTTFKTVTEPALKVTNAAANTKYEFRVAAFVNNPLGKTYGSWSTTLTHTNINAKSGPNATEQTTHIVWDAVAGATKYVVERYEYNNTPYAWVLMNANVTETSFIDTSITNAQAGCFGGLYRVSAYKDSTYLGSGTTEATTAGLTISKTNGAVTVGWTKVPNVTSYTVKTRAPMNKKDLYYSEILDLDSNAKIDKSASSYTFNLAPNENYTYKIWANNDILVAEFSVRTDDIIVDSSNTSKNAQALALVNAINKTKLEKGTVVVGNKSSLSTKINRMFVDGDLKILMLTIFGLDYSLEGKEIDEFLRDFDDSDMSSSSITENTNQTLTFNDGYATYNEKRSDGTSVSRTVLLKAYVEPSETSDRLAYLFNQHSSTVANSAFSSISTTNNADGSYKIVATLKQEAFGSSKNKPTPDYHPGFLSSIDLMTSGFGQGADIQKATLGATTVTANVNVNGTLSSLEIKSPFTATVTISMSMTSNDPTKEDIIMGMDMTGSTNINYTFTR